MTRTKVLIPLGVLLILVGLVVAAFPTLVHGRDAIVSLSQPVLEFDEGRPASFEVRAHKPRYMLSRLLESRDDPIPPMEVTVETPDGTPVETEEIEMWGRMMGRNYYRFLIIDPGDADRVTITVNSPDSDGSADFAVYTYFVDVTDRFTRSVRPAWIAGVIAVAMGGVVLVAGIASGRGRGAEHGLEIERP